VELYLPISLYGLMLKKLAQMKLYLLTFLSFFSYFEIVQDIPGKTIRLFYFDKTVEKDVYNNSPVLAYILVFFTV
jgi:hypothetical protein